MKTEELQAKEKAQMTRMTKTLTQRDSKNFEYRTI